MKAKMFTREVKMRKFPETTFFITVEQPMCISCSKLIENDKYFYLCGDFKLNKIWCEADFTDQKNLTHDKSFWKPIGNVPHHFDWYVVLKLVSPEAYNSLESQEIEID